MMLKLKIGKGFLPFFSHYPAPPPRKFNIDTQFKAVFERRCLLQTIILGNTFLEFRGV